jgi:hypothetical protein
MTPAELLITFFLFTLAAVSAAGYAFVLKPSRAEGQAGNAPLPLALDHQDLPAPQAAAVDVFRMMGEALPVWAARSGTQRVSPRRVSAWPAEIRPELFGP